MVTDESARLVALSEQHIVNAAEIADASRCGNYTHIQMRGPMGRFLQIWDEDMEVWNAIRAVTLPPL